MDITTIVWVFLFSVLGYYLYDNLFVGSPYSNEPNKDEEE